MNASSITLKWVFENSALSMRHMPVCQRRIFSVCYRTLVGLRSFVQIHLVAEETTVGTWFRLAFAIWSWTAKKEIFIRLIRLHATVSRFIWAFVRWPSATVRTEFAPMVRFLWYYRLAWGRWHTPTNNRWCSLSRSDRANEGQRNPFVGVRSAGVSYY